MQETPAGGPLTLEQLDVILSAVRDGATAMAADAHRMLDDNARMRDDMNLMLYAAARRTRRARMPVERARG